MNKAGQIFNLDKSGISFEHDAPNVVVGKGQKQIQSENKSKLTMVSCVNTVGQALASLIYFLILTLIGQKERCLALCMDLVKTDGLIWLYIQRMVLTIYVPCRIESPSTTTTGWPQFSPKCKGYHISKTE